MKTVTLLVALAATTVAFAANFPSATGPATRPMGETHCGNGYTKESAARSAEARAKAAADRKKTCYNEVDLSKCTRESDGTWTCCTTSANHAGSCN